MAGLLKSFPTVEKFLLCDHQQEEPPEIRGRLCEVRVSKFIPILHRDPVLPNQIRDNLWESGGAIPLPDPIMGYIEPVHQCFKQTRYSVGFLDTEMTQGRTTNLSFTFDGETRIPDFLTKLSDAGSHVLIAADSLRWTQKLTTFSENPTRQEIDILGFQSAWYDKIVTNILKFRAGRKDLRITNPLADKVS